MKKLLIMLVIFGMNVAANAQTKTDSTTVQKDSTMNKITELESIASGVKNGYLLIENGVVKGYKAMESGIVKGFTSVNDAITLKLFGKDGETIEQTKARLNANVDASRTRSKEIVENNKKATRKRIENASGKKDSEL